MIAPTTQLSIAVVPLTRIVVTEHQPRYLSRVEHYHTLLSDPANAGHYAGLVHLAPYGTHAESGEPLYTLLDGHHRYAASILAGRSELLAVIHEEPCDDAAPAEVAAGVRN